MSLGREIHKNALRNTQYFDICNKMRQAGINVTNEEFTQFIEEIYREIEEMVDDQYANNLKETHNTWKFLRNIDNKTQEFIDLHKQEGGEQK